jgi:hypothetical protein
MTHTQTDGPTPHEESARNPLWGGSLQYMHRGVSTARCKMTTHTGVATGFAQLMVIGAPR